MIQEHKDQIYNGNKTVVLLAECLNGALGAGRFAARLLFDQTTRIILLHTFQKPARGVSMMRDLTEVLRQTADWDLSVLKTKLVREFELPPENIEKAVIENDLRSVIEKDLSKHHHVSVVLGPDISNPFRRGSCRKIVRALVGSKIRPVFLISDHITMLEESRIVFIAEKEEDISPVYYNFLLDIYDKKDAMVEIITHENDKTIRMNQETSSHFSKKVHLSDLRENSTEQIFYDRLIRSGAV